MIAEAAKSLRQADRAENLFLTILAPAYNEEAILVESISRIYEYMVKFDQAFSWELVIVNDGSKDMTGSIAETLAEQHSNMRVIHHKINRNLGGALKTGFRHSLGYYIIVLDIDLSYAPEHIEKLLTESVETDADIVVASPYMKGGKSTKLPPMRLLLSKTVNFLMRIASPSSIHTYTGMVRAYKRDFLRCLNLKSSTYSINPEIIHKATILRGRITEIPAHLDWSFQKKAARRTSSIKIFSGILGGMMNSFIFRPYAYFMLIGGGLLLVSLYILTWICVHTYSAYDVFAPVASDFENGLSMAVAQVFSERPYSFLVGGVSLILCLQFLSLGFLSLQSKRYFDELFHLGSSQFRP